MPSRDRRAITRGLRSWAAFAAASWYDGIVGYDDLFDDPDDLELLARIEAGVPPPAKPTPTPPPAVEEEEPPVPVPKVWDPWSEESIATNAEMRRLFEWERQQQQASVG